MTTGPWQLAPLQRRITHRLQQLGLHYKPDAPNKRPPQLHGRTVPKHLYAFCKEVQWDPHVTWSQDETKTPLIWLISFGKLFETPIKFAGFDETPMVTIADADGGNYSLTVNLDEIEEPPASSLMFYVLDHDDPLQDPKHSPKGVLSILLDNLSRD